MRLSAREQECIAQTIRQQLGDDARIWLFGSRVDDAAEGGDIDLLVEVSATISEPVKIVSELVASLQLALGEQKIDLLLLDPGTIRQPIHQIAKSRGVELSAAPIDPELLRLKALLALIDKECLWLKRADRRLFAQEIDEDWLGRLETDDAASETLEAFVSRFGRLQDNLGDKLIPAMLRALAEKTGSALDNLNRAEKLGVLWSAREWLAARNLRNRMVHEYQSSFSDFVEALHLAHALTPRLEQTSQAIRDYLFLRLPELAKQE